MTDTQPLGPTDDELDELRQANSGRLNFVTFREFRVIARAVLAKWGARQPVAQEPMTRKQVIAICVESGHETATLQERADFVNGIRHAERHHGIKKEGQYAVKVGRVADTTMKTIKVSEATELQLDWLVAKCEGYAPVFSRHYITPSHAEDPKKVCIPAQSWVQPFEPSTSWAQAGPLLNQHKISRTGIDARSVIA